MKFPAIPNLNRQDFQDAPQWVSKLIYPLNLLLAALYNIFVNNLSFQDNLSCVLRSFVMTAGASDTNNTLTIPFNLGRQPLAVFLSANNAAGTFDVIYPQVSWNYISTPSGNNVQINGIKGLTSGVKYNIFVTVI